jgi:hypothetical protein
MDRILNPNRNIIDDKGINLGITNAKTPYLVNSTGDIVAFVQAEELFIYNKREKTISRVFSFEDMGNLDIRNLTPFHEIKLIELEKNGNLTFSVCGYMNRGEHEGHTGLALFYYQMDKNYVEEKGFFDSTLSYEDTISAYSSYAYFNQETDIVYAFDGKDFSEMKPNVERRVIAEDLNKETFVTSQTGECVAYVNASGDTIEIYDLKTGETSEISANGGETLRTLGFMGNDLVYGMSHKEDSVPNEEGGTFAPMYAVAIADNTATVYKTYEKENVLIKEVKFDDRMITLSRVQKTGEVYTDIEEDYITQNEDVSALTVVEESYVTDLLETQKRLAFQGGISDKKVRYLSPKVVISEKDRGLKFNVNV